MPSLGKIEEVNLVAMNINCYFEQLEQYFVVNSIRVDSSDSHRQKAIPISVIGAKVSTMQWQIQTLRR